MADKDWLKSFPRSYKKIAEYIEMNSFDLAIFELKTRISRKLNKNEVLIQVISRIADDISISGLLFFIPSELDKLSLKYFANIQANRDWKNYAKEAIKLGVMRRKGSDYKESILSHFFQKVIEKECTERIWNTSPLDKKHSYKVKEVRKKINSEELKQSIQSLVSILTIDARNRLSSSKAMKENSKMEDGIFNFLNMNHQRGKYAS